MMKIITKIASLVLFVLTVSCTKEDLNGSGSVPVGDEVELRFDAFGARATINPEDAVNRVRILVFGSTASQDRGQMLCNKFAVPDGTGKITPVIITTGVRNIYLIINEPRNANGSELDSYKNITKISDIEALELAYAGTSANPPYRPTDIPMFIKHTDQVIMPDSKNEISSEVERVMAKVTLNLKIKNSNFTQSEQPVIQNITIKNLPNKSYYVAKPYTGTFVNSETQQPTPMTVTGYDYACTNTFYVPEYILSKVDDNAYIEITGSIGHASGKAIKWIVKLGDAMVTGQSSFSDRYDIRRNSHYTMIGDVKSYGDREELDVEVTVSPWNAITGESELGDYLYFSRMTTADGSYSLNDGGYIVSGGETILFYCSTNVGKWYLKVTDSKNNRVTTPGPTGAVSSQTEQVFPVVFPASPDDPENSKDTYTIELYAPELLPEAAGPLRTFTLNQNDGVLPNSVLIKKTKIPGSGDVTFDGWPVDKLPKGGGLRIAERAGVEDPLAQWSTESWSNNINVYTCGFGKSNTAVLVKRGIAKYPAAKICDDLNKADPEGGWYLPTRDEMINMQANQKHLRSKYAITTNVYWCCSEFDDQYAWYVNFGGIGSGNPFAGDSPKSSTARVRCVRNL